ncbi:uncharacterized protein LOC142549751 [Primulina tabacum]|uniref:uncharacterized protein LOC142549751 n=1 Tax=Primulina tabacum TaxID=48773 RepID=UPI003F5A6F32
MSFFWALIFLSFAFIVNCSESKNQKKLPSAVLVGTVYCDTCFHQDFPKASRAIEGATVAVECKNTRSSPSFRREVKTDNHGEFKVNLPFSVSKHVKEIKGCSVKLISSNEPYCAVAATATSTLLNLKSKKEGVHIFSAGFFTFKPLNQPQICDQKPIIWNFKKQRVDDDKSSMVLNANDPAFLQPVQDLPYNPPVLGHLPPLPLLPRLPPLPQLPQLPPLPGIPYLPPVPAKETAIKSLQLSDEEINQPATSNIPFVPNPFNPPIIPPNPLQPPPALLPPVVPSPPASIFPPVFPSPPATIFPPVLPAPPSPPVFKLPPIPGFTPSAPPPPPPFPISFPPFPFQPTPGFPGVPPADVSSSP